MTPAEPTEEERLKGRRKFGGDVSSTIAFGLRKDATWKPPASLVSAEGGAVLTLKPVGALSKCAMMTIRDAAKVEAKRAQDGGEPTGPLSSSAWRSTVFVRPGKDVFVMRGYVNDGVLRRKAVESSQELRVDEELMRVYELKRARGRLQTSLVVRSSSLC